METRQKTEYKTYALCLANMHGGVDKAQPVAVFDELDKLKAFYNNCLTEPYVDAPSEDNFGVSHPWNKVFKKGSLLEWFNPLSSNGFNPVSWHDAAFGGVIENWTESYPASGAFTVPFNPVS